MNCQVCSKSLDVAKICSRCKNGKYCSVDCQKKDWPTHKLNCRPVSKPTEVKTEVKEKITSQSNKEMNFEISDDKEKVHFKEEDGKKQEIPIYNEPLSKEEMEKRQRKAQILVDFFEKLETGDKLLREGNFDEAKPLVKKCLDLLPECIMEEYKKDTLFFSLYWNLGRVEEEKAAYTEAIEYIQKAKGFAEKLERFVNLTELSNDIGRIYSKQDKHKEAIEQFLQALETAEKVGNENYGQDKLKAIIYMNIGNCHLMNKEYEKAKEYFLLQKETCVKSGANQKGNFNVGAGQAEFNLGRVYFKMGLFAEALVAVGEWLQMCEKINSMGKLETAIVGHKNSLWYVGRIHYRLKEYEKAVGMFEKLEKVSEDNANKILAIVGKSKVLFKQSLNDEAVSVLDKALETYPEDFSLNYTKAKIYLNVENKKEEAIKILNKLKEENAKDGKRLKKIEKQLSK